MCLRSVSAAKARSHAPLPGAAEAQNCQSCPLPGTCVLPTKLHRPLRLRSSREPWSPRWESEMAACKVDARRVCLSEEAPRGHGRWAEDGHHSPPGRSDPPHRASGPQGTSFLSSCPSRVIQNNGNNLCSTHGSSHVRTNS